ncbi:DOMON-like domain-containing protein [Phenylobacterium aquaticum]|uniref:DOMON-like domain-containing protein n=1 Tax=Phenylobacterium aquaticum TaxID=1763816 RepID=UPI0026EC6AD4|nr:DOMON-like domain-containing protein [Phenylobacterium aquaticum]
MRLALVRHPDSQGQAAAGVEVELTWPTRATLALTYVVSGDVSGLLLPPPAPSARTDELWRHTCLEAFVGEVGKPGYYEINLAPSGQWAAYRFSAYREAMRPALEVADPGITLVAAADHFTLSGRLSFESAPDLAPAAWRLALTAVIEQTDGAKSYWALAHPPGRADFHHDAGFTHLITAAERA